MCEKMKKIKKTANTKNSNGRLPGGVAELIAAIGTIALVALLIFGIHYLVTKPWVKNGIMDDNSAPGKDSPTQTIMNPIPVENVTYPFKLTEELTVDKVYTATGYFPEDGTDEAMEKVLAVKLTNSSEKTLEYLTFTLNVSGESYKFAAATVPAKKSVYVFNTKSKTAPEKVSSLEGDVEFEIYFAEEPSKKTESLSYSVKTGSIVVKNISEKDIKSDIMVYYKSTADGGYLGGITYRFRIKGGLEAGKSFSAYAPHSYAHMTEIMFVQYDE